MRAGVGLPQLSNVAKDFDESRSMIRHMGRVSSDWRFREQAQQLFAAVMEKAGRESLLMLFLGRLAESPAVRR